MTTDTPTEIDVHTLAQMSTDGSHHTILDIREHNEVATCAINDSLHIPMQSLPQNLESLPKDGMLVVLCHGGHRSLQAMTWLRGEGFANATSLRGGITAWAREIDPSVHAA